VEKASDCMGPAHFHLAYFFLMKFMRFSALQDSESRISLSTPRTIHAYILYSVQTSKILHYQRGKRKTKHRLDNF
jgi:hypothetical protein